MHGAGHQDALAEERLRVEPAKVVAQAHDVADDRERGQAEPRLRRALVDVGERSRDGALLRQRRPLDDGHGRIGRAPVLDQELHQRVELAHPHEDDQRLGGGGELRPVVAGAVLLD